MNPIKPYTKNKLLAQEKNTLLQYGNSNVTSGKQKHIFAHTELN